MVYTPLQLFQLLGMKLILFLEGGESDIPQDAGGPTDYGITQGTFSYWLSLRKQPDRSVDTITMEEVEAIYKSLFWDAGHCPLIKDQGLALAHFQWYVNTAPDIAIKSLQTAVGVTPDGLFGPITLEAVQTASGNAPVTAYFNSQRQNYYEFVQYNPSQQMFLDGWENRIKRTERFLVLAGLSS